MKQTHLGAYVLFALADECGPPPIQTDLQMAQPENLQNLCALRKYVMISHRGHYGKNKPSLVNYIDATPSQLIAARCS